MTRLLFAFSLPLLLGAQTFETASVRPSGGGPCGGSYIEPMPGGGLRVECLPLKTFLNWAYQVQDYQVSGGPGWIESDRWNIIAKAPEGGITLTYEQMTEDQRKQTGELVRKRLQALLAQRFQLTLRHETREQPVYALTVARGGPKLKLSENQSASGSIRLGRGMVKSIGARIDMATHFLAVTLGRPVIDRTGLTAHYDFELHWADDDTGPSLFTAIQELGLKLEASKGPVEMLVIERIEKPAEN